MIQVTANARYSIAPSTNNDCVELCGVNNAFFSGVRYRNGVYDSVYITSAHDGIAEVGESYIVCYK